MIPIFDAVVSVIDTLVDRLVPDKNEAAKVKAELRRVAESNEQEVVLAQLEVNKQEAKHTSIFVAGWRPAVGWVCALGIAVVAFQPIIAWGAALTGWQGTLPEPNVDLVLTLLGGMLGLGGMRTVEKWKGVARSGLGTK